MPARKSNDPISQWEKNSEGLVLCLASIDID
jgi:hypothetical protein